MCTCFTLVHYLFCSVVIFEHKKGLCGFDLKTGLPGMSHIAGGDILHRLPNLACDKVV